MEEEDFTKKFMDMLYSSSRKLAKRIRESGVSEKEIESFINDDPGKRKEDLH